MERKNMIHKNNQYLNIFMLLTLFCGLFFFVVSRSLHEKQDFCQDTYIQSQQDSIAE